jgi:hypothetical protein
MLRELILFSSVLGVMLIYGYMPPLLQGITIGACSFLYLYNSVKYNYSLVRVMLGE